MITYLFMFLVGVFTGFLSGLFGTLFDTLNINIPVDGILGFLLGLFAPLIPKRSGKFEGDKRYSRFLAALMALFGFSLTVLLIIPIL